MQSVGDIESNAAAIGLPKIAIIGRPNVGKSTLFNRLIRERRSITHSQPGVTRDPVTAVLHLPTRQVALTDTGGIAVEVQSELYAQVAERALRLAAEAAVILLVLDVAGVTGEDHQLVEQMRPFSDRVVVVVNKVDHEGRDAAAAELHSLGFAPVLAVSAAHGRGIEELLRHLADRVTDISQHQPPAVVFLPRIALLGRPNSGKSTLFNKLTGGPNALVAEEPGTTRDSSEIQFEHEGRSFLLVDTAGMRRRSRVIDAVEYYATQRAVAAAEQADVVVLMIDAAEGLADQDKKIATLVVRRGSGLVIALNKWDALEPVPNRYEATVDRIRFLFPILEFAPIQAISAKTGYGVGRLLRVAEQVRAQLDLRIATPRLNQALQRWVNEYEPGRVRQHRVKYATQLGGRPPRFVFFSNRRDGLPRNYTSYLRNRLRAEFDLRMVPVSIEVRPRSER